MSWVRLLPTTLNVYRDISVLANFVIDILMDVNKWSLVDLIFAVAVASFPTLNALLPKSWRRRDVSVSAPSVADNAHRGDIPDRVDTESQLLKSERTSSDARTFERAGSQF